MTPEELAALQKREDKLALIGFIALTLITGVAGCGLLGVLVYVFNY